MATRRVGGALALAAAGLCGCAQILGIEDLTEGDAGGRVDAGELDGAAFDAPERLDAAGLDAATTDAPPRPDALEPDAPPLIDAAPGERTLTVERYGEGTVLSSPSGINCGTTCAASFPVGSTVLLTPTPQSGWVFEMWGGACSGAAPCSVDLTTDLTVVARFKQLHELAVTRQGTGATQGTVTSDPSGISCGTACAANFVEGATVTLTAAAGAGDSFIGWAGDCAGFLPCTLQMIAPRSVTAVFSAIGEFLLAVRWGSGDGTLHEALAVAPAPGGDVVVAGRFDGTMTFGSVVLTAAGGSATTTDVFVARLDSSGNPLWARGAGSTQDDAAHGLAVAPNGDVLVTGRFAGSIGFPGCSAVTSRGGTDAFVARLGGADGACLWLKAIGSNGANASTDNEWGRAVAITPGENVVVAGQYMGTVDLGGGSVYSQGAADGFLVTYAPDGAYVRAFVFGGTGHDDARDVAVDETGLVYSTGAFTGSVNFGGGSVTSLGLTDVFVSVRDAGGAHVFTKAFGTVNAESPGGLSAAAGAVVVTGAFSGPMAVGGFTLPGSNDVFLVKLKAPGGSIEWARAKGGVTGTTEIPADVMLDARGNVSVAGAFLGTAGTDLGCGPLPSLGGTSDVFVASYGPDGVGCRWARTFGGTSDPQIDMDGEAARAIAADGIGRLWIAGRVHRIVDFGGGATTGTMGYEAFVALYGP